MPIELPVEAPIAPLDSTALKPGQPDKSGLRPGDGKMAGSGLGSDQRREPRYPCNDLAEVRNLSQNLGPLPARVLDISRSGLRLETAVAMSRGAKLEILLPAKAIILGNVRYIRRVADRYQAGVFIEDVYHTRQSFVRRHLNDYQLSLYLAREGGSACEILSVREHLLQCNHCTARYQAVVKLRERIRPGLQEQA